MHTLIQILGTFFTVVCLTVVFVATGWNLLQLAFASQSKLHPALEAGFGYFLGMATFLSFWRAGSFVLHSAKLSFWLVVCAVLVFNLIFLKHQSRNFWERLKEFSARTIVALCGLFLFVVVFELAIWLQIAPTPALSFRDFGSAHSARYSNIAETIYQTNRTPILNQNFGQSLLAAAPMYISFKLPLLSLNLWLDVSIFFLVVTAYGLFRHFGLKSKQAVFGSFLFMVGGTALSLTHVLSLDSNNPFLMSSYTDATAGVGTFLLFLFLALFACKENQPVSPRIFLPAILGIYWNFSAPQNVILGLGLLGALCVFKLYQIRNFKSGVFAFSLCFLLFSALGATQGGMLTPAAFRDKDTIPGAADVFRQDQYTGIKPELPYALVWGDEGEYGTPYEPAEKAMFVSVLRGGEKLSWKMFEQALWRLETNAWSALRVMFFPLLGLIAYYFFRSRLDADQEKLSQLNHLWWASILVFILGFFIAFTIIISGRKWEMSRFMTMPYALGLMFFAISLYLWAERINSRHKKALVLMIIAFIMTFGPLANSIKMIQENFPKTAVIKQKFGQLVKDPGVVGKGYMNQPLWDPVKYDE